MQYILSLLDELLNTTWKKGIRAHIKHQLRDIDTQLALMGPSTQEPLLLCSAVANRLELGRCEAPVGPAHVAEEVAPDPGNP